MTHECINHIDVRFAGRDDFEGHLICTVCRREYEADELREMHIAAQREPMEQAA
jgi:hypothetical protein